MLIRIKCYLFLLALLGSSQWGIAISSEVEVNIGFAGNIVSGALNPVTVTLRNEPAAWLDIAIDQGSLQTGEQWINYHLPFNNGNGVTRFNYDVYVPANWRRFTWAVRTKSRSPNTIASGSFDPRQHEKTPLTLVVARDTAAASPWLQVLLGDDAEDDAEEARVVYILAKDLANRSSAYSGVKHLLLLQSNTTIDPTTLAAAAAAGTTVIITKDEVEQTINTSLSSAALTRLAPQPHNRLGAGKTLHVSLAELEYFHKNSQEKFITRASSNNIAKEIQPPFTIQQAFNNVSPKNDNVVHFSNVNVLLLALGYAFGVLVLLARGGVPGLVSGVAVAALASVIVWSMGRNMAKSYVYEQTVTFNGGDLSLGQTQQTIFSFGQSQHKKPANHYPIFSGKLSRNGMNPQEIMKQSEAFSNWQVAGMRLELTLPRWSYVHLAQHKKVGPAMFSQKDGMLNNNTPYQLTNIIRIKAQSEEEFHHSRVYETSAKLAPNDSLKISDIVDIFDINKNASSYNPLFLASLPIDSIVAKANINNNATKTIVYVALPPLEESP